MREACSSVFDFDSTGFEILGGLPLPSIVSDDGLKNLGSQAPTHVVVENTSNGGEYSKPKSSSSSPKHKCLEKNVKSPKRHRDVSTAPMPQDTSHPRGVAISSTAPADQVLRKYLSDFSDSIHVVNARVAKLRERRVTLIEERFFFSKQLRLAEQQLLNAEAQQAAAANAEDFDLADKLAPMIEKYTHERDEHNIVIKNIGLAFDELKRHRASIVSELTDCFRNIRKKLELFEGEEQQKMDEHDAEATSNFEATSYSLRAESERLSSFLQHIYTEERQAEEEQTALEATIVEENSDTARLREQTCVKLNEVDIEICSLREQLKIKEDEAEELSSTIAFHDSEMTRVRDSYKPTFDQLEIRLETAKENCIEWQTDDKALDKMKECHENEMEAHSIEVMKHNQIMSKAICEITDAERFERVVGQHIDTMARMDGVRQSSNKLVALQSDLLDYGSAVEEAMSTLAKAEADMKNTKAEIQGLEKCLPVLELEKKNAVSTRNFKAAGKASKEIKQASSRIKTLIGMVEEELTHKIWSTKKEMEDIVEKLNKTKSEMDEKEKEEGIKSMRTLAIALAKLEEIKEDHCNLEKCESFTIPAIGALILEDELISLRKEGDALDSKFSGWSEILQWAMDKANNEGKSDTDVVGIDSFSKTVKVDDTTMDNSCIQASNRVDQSSEPSLNKNELKQQIEETEGKLNTAIEEEDYDLAGELDVVLNKLKVEMEALADERCELNPVEDTVDKSNPLLVERKKSDDLISDSDSSSSSVHSVLPNKLPPSGKKNCYLNKTATNEMIFDRPSLTQSSTQSTDSIDDPFLMDIDLGNLNIAMNKAYQRNENKIGIGLKEHSVNLLTHVRLNSPIKSLKLNTNSNISSSKEDNDLAGGYAIYAKYVDSRKGS